jgi:hypothetical protein
MYRDLYTCSLFSPQDWINPTYLLSKESHRIIRSFYCMPARNNPAILCPLCGRSPKKIRRRIPTSGVYWMLLRLSNVPCSSGWPVGKNVLVASHNFPQRSNWTRILGLKWSQCVWTSAVPDLARVSIDTSLELM